MIPQKLNVLLQRSVALTLKRKLHAPRNILKLNERGLINSIFPNEAGPEMAEHFETGSRTLYAGFDPTAESLHVGNLLVIVPLLHALRAGHKVIALVGGATARIGDPSGKSTERPMLPSEEVERNVQGIRNNLQAIFDNHAEIYGDQCKHDLRNVIFVDNYEWYKDVKLLDFLGKTGRHFRMGTMLSKSSVKDRIASDEGMSFTEFTYQTFQAYDWLHLHRTYGCTVQVGGSDQFGNIHAGHELISRLEGRKKVYGITLPLVTSETGEKLGKSAGAKIWLSSSKTSEFDFFQYFLRLPDKEVEKMLHMFSLLPLGEIRQLINEGLKAPEKRIPQRKLAKHMTQLVHGEKGLNLAEKTTSILYENDIGALAKTDASELKAIFNQAPYVRLLFSAGTNLLDFAMKIGCFKTEKDAIRIISAGGFYVNEIRRQNIEEVLIPGNHVLANNTSLVRVGKKNYFLVEWAV